MIFELLMSYGSEIWYSSGFNRSFSLKPVETGRDIMYRLKTSRRGDGIARVQGFVIFVKNGHVGQNVKAKITQVRDSLRQK